jgi:hypothetical protein
LCSHILSPIWVPLHALIALSIVRWKRGLTVDTRHRLHHLLHHVHMSHVWTVSIHMLIFEDNSFTFSFPYLFSIPSSSQSQNPPSVEPVPINRAAGGWEILLTAPRLPSARLASPEESAVRILIPNLATPWRSQIPLLASASRITAPTAFSISRQIATDQPLPSRLPARRDHSRRLCINSGLGLRMRRMAYQ